jgi:hypothetical protein
MPGLHILNLTTAEKMPCRLITTYVRQARAWPPSRWTGASAAATPTPTPPSWEDADDDEEEADNVSLSFYEFLEGLNATQEGEVPPTNQQEAIAASFETQRQERGVSMAPRHPPPSPAVLLHQEMVCGRVERRQAIADSIAWRARASALKEATGSKVGPSSAQSAPPRDDDHLF